MSSEQNVDPFFLLKEVIEMSKYDSNNMTAEQMISRQNYNALVNKTYEAEKTTLIQKGFDPDSIKEKMKSLKFAKGDLNKDAGWFQKYN